MDRHTAAVVENLDGRGTDAGLDRFAPELDHRDIKPANIFVTRGLSSSWSEVFQQPKVLKIIKCATKFSPLRNRSSYHLSPVDSYLQEPLTFIRSMKILTDSAPAWYMYCFYDCRNP